MGVCHPGIHSIQTGLVKNAPNSFWINGKPLQRDLRSEIGKEIYCENDANCFALSEAIDGSGKHYKIVFGVILGSGVGGGLVIDKRIVNGPNGITGEWGHIPLGKPDSKNNIDGNVGYGGRESRTTYYPPGCFYHSGYNKYYWNPNTKSTKQCSNSRKCICKPKTCSKCPSKTYSEGGKCIQCPRDRPYTVLNSKQDSIDSCTDELVCNSGEGYSMLDSSTPGLMVCS